ncbi:MAG: hypothetical protein FWF24_00900 [Alphaproteobacteria bacterium]|nr:hypothetical protein [Alphaproteobacteria bacterium]
MPVQMLTFGEYRRLTPEIKLKSEIKTAAASLCTSCKGMIEKNDPAGDQYINKKRVCSDCYFGALGQAIDKRPIGLPCMGQGFKPHKRVL